MCWSLIELQVRKKVQTNFLFFLSPYYFPQRICTCQMQRDWLGTCSWHVPYYWEMEASSTSLLLPPLVAPTASRWLPLFLFLGKKLIIPLIGKQVVIHPYAALCTPPGSGFHYGLYKEMPRVFVDSIKDPKVVITRLDDATVVKQTMAWLRNPPDSQYLASAFFFFFLVVEQ